MVKVPSDPAQVIVSHASFRVQLGAASRRTRSPRVARSVSGIDASARMPAAGAAGRPGAAPRRRPVVWTGKSVPDDTGAHRLLQAVRSGSVRHSDEPSADPGATQVIPRFGAAPGYGADADPYGDPYADHGDLDRTAETPVVGPQRTAEPGGARLLPHMRSGDSAYEESSYGAPGHARSVHPGADGAPPHGGVGYAQPPYGADEFHEPGETGAYGQHGEYAGHGEYDEHGEYAGYDEYGEYDEYGPDGFEGRRTGRDAAGEGETRRGRRQGDDPARHAYFPGRRMNLGVVLLPLRIFLGFVSVYAGMGKLCDPLYFDGGKRGSMVKWLTALHPWEVAEPLRQFALQHPVGSGLFIAFLQVIVGVLTVLGCWQRVAAAVGALLSAALIVTVSWRTAPVYDAPDIIYLAAWSPLIIAGAPVYSVDGRLAASAWRRLGPRSDIWDLRRYVLRRGALLTVVVTGLTLLVGSLLGGAVRDADRVVAPGSGQAPRNELPGSPLPQRSGEQRQHQRQTSPPASTTPSHRGASAGPSDRPATTSGSTGRGSGGAPVGGSPSQTQGAGQVPRRHSAPVEQAPSTSAGPTSGGGTSGGAGSSGGSGSSGGDGGGASSGRPGLVGGLLGDG
ncbi:DoxX family membrane protein [Streptomyces sp. NPDC046985]|uniref:DoxX family protein n=1 Tax=Streptomyces sp. NPDC046985 TaxID=3155377 RepID=UPI0033F4E12F